MVNLFLVCVSCAIPIYPHLLGPEITGYRSSLSYPIYKYWSSNIWGPWGYDSMDGFEGIPRKAFTLIQWTSHEYTMEYHISHDIPWIYQCFPDLFTIFVGYISYIPIFPMNQRDPGTRRTTKRRRGSGSPKSQLKRRTNGWLPGLGREWNTGNDWKCWDAELIFIGLSWNDLADFFSDALLEVLDFNKQVRPFFIHCNKCGVTSRDVAQPSCCKNHRPVDRGQWSHTK